MPRSLHARLSRLEQRHHPMRTGVVEVPCEPGQDILEQAESRGLLDGLAAVILVPAPVPPEEWEASAAAELAWMAQQRAGAAETELPLK
jgi:hypothetical protein